MLDEGLRALVAELLELPVNEVTPDLRRADTDAWDSMNHLRLITALESEYGTSFTMQEIAQLQTLAELQSILVSRGSLH